MYLKTNILPKFLTPLVYSHLSTSQYNSVQQQYTISSISSMGFNNAWTISLRYGDHEHYSFQLKHLEIEALNRHISNLHILLFKPRTSQLVLPMLA